MWIVHSGKMVGARPLIVRESPGAGQPAALSGCQMSWGGSKNFAILSWHFWHLARGAGSCVGQIAFFLRSVLGHMPARKGDGSLPLMLIAKHACLGLCTVAAPWSSVLATPLVGFQFPGTLCHQQGVWRRTCTKFWIFFLISKIIY